MGEAEEEDVEGTLRLVAPQAAVIVLTLLGLASGWGRFVAGAVGYGEGAMIANSLWSAYNILALWPIIRAAMWTPDPEFDLPVMQEYRNALS